jgi:voltage-gated potassium channel
MNKMNPTPTSGKAKGWRDLLDELYESRTERARKFRYALLTFDFVTVGFVIATSFLQSSNGIEVLDTAFGLVILADFVARMLTTRNRLKHVLSLTTLADVAAIISFLLPIAGEGIGFLRILRTLRLLRTYNLIAQLRKDFVFFRRNEDIVVAAANLMVFIFIMTGLIYVTQHTINPDISNYADALYFTVTTLTTTGFGDITLNGTFGRMMAVTVMIFGVTLFLRLAQVLFRPIKARYVCKDCGLTLHDPDAVHCKHCGALVHIQTEGFT